MALPLSLITLPFAALSAATLLDALTLRQNVFLIEQNSLYCDLDGDDRRGWHLLLRAPAEAGALVGYARVVIDADAAVIGRLVLASHWRRGGIGRYLLEAAMAVASAKGEGLPQRLSAQYPLREWYSRSGFVAEGEPYDDGGILHITMVRPWGGASAG